MGLLAGCRKEIGRSDRAPMHMVEVGVVRGSSEGHHGITASAWVGTRGAQPVFAPRIGGQVGMLLSLGAELVYLTDLEKGTLQFVPSIGFIGFPVRMALEPHVRLANKEFRPVESGTLSITFRFATLLRCAGH
jgi:hypothetical protein